MKRKITILSAACLALFISSCDRFDAKEVELSVEASALEVKAGEQIDFTIFYENAQSVVAYTGDEGHEYKMSGDYFLTGLTPEELRDSIYRVPNPLIKRYFRGFSQLTSIPEDVEYQGAEGMELVEDIINKELGTVSQVLKVPLYYPNDWGKALRIFPRVGLDVNNQNLVIRLRFDSNSIFEKVGNDWTPTSKKTNFRIVTDVIGKTADGEVLWAFDQASPNSLWYGNVITPSDAYFNHTVNLGKWIENWEKKNNAKLQTVECIILKFIGDNSASYKGDIFISSIDLGVDGYYDFATGVNVPLLDGSNKAKFSYTFDKPGEYDVSFLGIGNSTKNYSGDGYQSDRADINIDNYKYGKKLVTIPITVE